jgi:hypothetical protein
MLEAFSTPRNKKRTFILFAVCVALAAAAAIVGIGDNPPGLLLAFLSASAFIVAFVHPWRASKKFKRLIYASGLGFVVFAVLHNVFEGLASKAGVSGLVHGLLGGVGVAFFLVAILLCPPGLLVGAVGAIVMSRRERHSQPGAPAA